MTKVSPTVIVFLAIIAAGSLCAGVIPGRWEKVRALERGSAIIVFLQEGDRLECAYQALEEEQLIVATSDQAELTLPKSTIRKVTSAQPISDSTRNGTWIGAGIGFGAGFASMVAVEKSKTASGYRFAEENVGYALAGGLAGAAAGAVLGRIIDAKTKAAEVFYEAP